MRKEQLRMYSGGNRIKGGFTTTAATTTGGGGECCAKTVEYRRKELSLVAILELAAAAGESESPQQRLP